MRGRSNTVPCVLTVTKLAEHKSNWALCYEDLFTVVASGGKYHLDFMLSIGSAN